MRDYKWASKEQSKKLNEIMQVLEPYCTEYLVNNSYILIIIPDNYKDLIDKQDVIMKSEINGIVSIIPPILGASGLARF